MKKAFIFILVLMALSGMYVSPSQADCMVDVVQMQDQVAKYGQIYTVDGTYIDNVWGPVNTTGNPCRGFGYGLRSNAYSLQWRAGNWGDTLTAH